MGARKPTQGAVYYGPVTPIRVVEVLAALSLTTDLASGLPFEKGLRTCCVADEFAGALGLSAQERSVVFHTALLRAVGCTSHAPENAQMFVDDTAFSAALKALDFGDPEVFGRQLAAFGNWAGPEQAPALSALFAQAAPTVGPYAASSGCEVSRALGTRIGLAADAVLALDDVYERWDGLGIPSGKSGEALTLAGRIVHIAEQAVLAFYTGGTAAAQREVRRRAGGHLDPALAAQFVAAAQVFAPLALPDALAEVMRREPQPHAVVHADGLARLCGALAIVADLKSTHMLGHSQHVAALAVAAGTVAELAPDQLEALRAAALVHNIGSTVVPSSLLDKSGPLAAVELERLSLQTYWTERILLRCPALAHLGPLAVAASAQHARLAADGYGTREILAAAPSVEVQVLLAAEAYAALTEPRPGRAPLPAEQAGAMLLQAATEGSIAAQAVRWVIAGASQGPGVGGRVRGRGERVGSLADPLSPELTPREIEVLTLAARGLRNRDIAQELVISERTVGHHLAHIYDKTGRRTRAGVAVYAIEHGLIPGGK